MPRARLLKPGFFKNEDLARLTPLHRLLFEGLWTLADREGRLEDRPERIKAEILPYDRHVTIQKLDGMLTDLAARGFIVRYSHKTTRGDVVRYVAVPTFLDHQTPHHREPASRIPAPRSGRPARNGEPKAQPRARSKAAPHPSLSDPVPDPVPVPDPETESETVYGDGSKSSAADAAHASALEAPTENVSVITRLAHEAILLVGVRVNGEGWPVETSDLEETVRVLCAQQHVAYNTDVVVRAIRSAVKQRSHPR